MDDRTQKVIARLSEALLLLSCVRSEGDTSSVPIHIGPADSGHTIHVTARTAEALTDAVDSINAYMASESVEDDKLGNALRQIDAVIDIDYTSLDRRKDELVAWMAGQSRESIPSGEWSAGAVAQNDTDLWDQVNELFDKLDPIEITDKVIRDRQADLPDVTQLLDELFGDIPYPYDEEDVPLPHDQAQMDALTAEVEQHLAEGGE